MSYAEVAYLESSPRTIDGESPVTNSAEGFPHYSSGGRFYLNVSAQSGTTPTLDVSIVYTKNSIEYTLGAFTQVGAATGSEVIEISNCPRDVKIKYTITGGTPSYTFEVNGTRG